MSVIRVIGDNIYVYIDEDSANISWTEARDDAAAAGGHLVTLTSAAENALIQGLANSAGYGDYWIGLSDATTEGVYQWVTGEAFGFSAWASGEPNNFDGDEDFVSGNFRGTGWNDNDNAISRDPLTGYIIEFETNAGFLGAGNPFRDRQHTFFGSDGADSMSGGRGNETMYGGGGFDTMLGNVGNDALVGGLGRDVMRGGAGRDTLVGGNGADRLYGDAGPDVFRATAAAHSTGASHDTIVGFNFTADRFDLPVGVSGIAEEVDEVTLNRASLVADLTALLPAAALGIQEAVLVTATAGDLAGAVFLAVDGDGVAGWANGQDYLFRLVGAVNLGALSTSDFI